MSQVDGQPRFARREVIAGAGALIGISAASSNSAEAQKAPSAAGTSVSGVGRATPIATTIASPPASGRIYRHVMQWDFTPETPTAQRAYGGYGVYSSNTVSFLWASMEIPAGARVRDIEWYVRNNTASNVTGLARIWAAGTGTLFVPAADCPIAPGTSITATKAEVPLAYQGPYPTGTKLTFGLRTGPTNEVQVNGVRVGFSDGVGQVALRVNQFNALDSRTDGGKFTAGETRTITLPESVFPPGAVGVLVNVQALNGTAGGFLRIYPFNGTPPSRSLYYGTAPTAQMLTVFVGANRKIKVFANQPVHVILDIAGTIA